MRPRHLLALVLALSGSARAASALNVVTAVEVKDEGAAVVLQVKGSKPPSFTTFSMADPPRFVIDLSEARFQGVPEDLVVRDGVVNLVKNLSYGSDASSIARIMVAFQLEVDPPDVQAVGDTLVIRIAKPAGAAAPMVAGDDAKKREAERAEAEAKAREEAARAEAKAKEQEEAARAEAKAKEQEEAARAEAKAKEQEEAARAEAKAKEAEEAARADAKAKDAEEAARAEAKAKDAEEAARAEAKAKEQEEAARAAEAQARADAERAASAAAERAEVAAADKARADAAAAEKAGTEARAAYEQDRQAAVARAEEDARARARAEEETREADARAQAEAERKAKDDAAARAAEQVASAEREPAGADGQPGAPEPEPAAAEAAAVAVQDAAPEAAGPATADASADRLGVGSPRAQLREVGFRQLPGASRVFVRTTSTPRFTIQDVGENVIRVELENTRATRRNDLRHLDTSFFPSAVAVVTPARQGSSYVLEIKLRERVPYQQRIEGDMLAIDFERPAASGSLPVAGTTPSEAGDGAERVPAALEGEAATAPAAN